MKSTFTETSCSCNGVRTPVNNTVKKPSKIGKPLRAVPSVLLSIVIAFFPKCPMCWALYMSMLGNLGLSKIPYYSWLYPVLFLFLGLHLFLLYRKAHQNGYLPLLISVLGAACMLSVRLFLPEESWLSILGMSCMIAGSLLNSLMQFRVQQRVYKQQLITS